MWHGIKLRYPATRDTQNKLRVILKVSTIVCVELMLVQENEEMYTMKYGVTQ